jgi:fibronectin-binding autotransporter adhesin
MQLRVSAQNYRFTPPICRFMNHKLLFVTSVICGISAIPALATDYTWQGGSGNDITNAANWVGGNVPPLDGSNLRLASGDRILFSAGGQYIPDESGRVIFVDTGSAIHLGAAGENGSDAQLNIAGTGVGGTGAIVVGGGGWGKPQHIRLTADALIGINGNQRSRTDGGANRLDLNNFALTYSGSGEANLVNTNVQANAGVINANVNFSVEGETTFNSGVVVNLAPNVLMASWGNSDNRIDAKINMANNATIETRLGDRNLTYVNDITITGANAIFRPAIQAQNQAGDGTDLRLIIQGKIQGSGQLERQGTGTLILSGSNTYSGGTNINGAGGTRTLVANDTALGTGTVTVNSASVIDFTNAGGLEYRDSNGVSSGPSGSPIGINPTLSGLHSTQQFADTRFLYTGKIRNNTGGNVVYTFAKQYDDDGYVEVNGNIVVNDTNWNGIATGQITLGPGEHDVEVAVRNGGGGAGPNGGWDKGIGLSTTMNLGAATQNNGDYAKFGDALELYQGVNRTIANNFVLNQNTTFSVARMNGYGATMTGNVSGSGNFIVQGDAVLSTDSLTLTGSNTYTGGTTVSDTVLKLSGSGTLPDTTNVNLLNNLASFDISLLTGVSEQIGSLSGVSGSTLVLGSKQLITGDGNNTSYFGNSSGAGGLRKVGSGSFTLGSTQNYSGETIVDAGSLLLNIGGEPGTLAGQGPITINNGGTLIGNTVDALGYYTNTGTNVVNINEGGILTVLENLRLSMDRNLNVVGGTITSQQNVNFDNGASYTFRDSGNGPINTYNFTSSAGGVAAVMSGKDMGLLGNATFTVADGPGAVDLNVTGNFVNNFGTGGFTKTGAGVMRLSGNNSYTGTTVLNGGTLLLGANNVLPDSSPLNLLSGTFKTDGYSDVLGQISVGGNVVIDLSSGNSILSFADVGTWTGILNIWNWTGAVWTAGGTDQLLFLSNQGNVNLANVNFYSDAGITPIGSGGAGFVGNELVPVPEPSALAVSAVLLGLIGFRERRTAVRRRQRAI